MMARDPHENTPFDESSMKLCTKIAHPNTEQDGDGKWSETTLLSRDLCDCEYCDSGSGHTSTLPILGFAIINLLID